MATLTTGWVSYATASFDSGPATIKFFLEAKYSSQNTTNNTTTVQTRLRSAYTEGSSMSGSGYKFTCTYASTVSGSGVWYFGNEVITSGSKPIGHNGDGTKSITISASAYNKYWNFTKNLSATVTLPTIKRQANITSAPDFNDEANPTISYSNPAGNGVSSLQACISLTGSADDVVYRNINKTGELKYTFNLTEAERNVLRNATTTSNSRTVKFYVKTVIGGSTYYSSLTKTLTIVNANPDLTKTIVETNQKVIDVLGDNSASSLIQNASNVNITVTPTTLKGATVKSVAVNHNGTIQTITSSPYTFNIPVTSDSFVITVTDSRNNTSPVSSGTITKTLIPYQKVKQNRFSFKRVNPTSSNITFTLDSIYYQQTFGSVVNSPTITWKNGASGTVHTLTSQQYTIDNTNHTINVNLTIENELDYRSQETFYVEVSDALSSWSNNMLVSKGIPVFEFGDDEVQVNGELYLADINRENRINIKDVVTGGGVLLYENNDGSNGTITLSDSAENYNYIEIFYRTNDNDYSSVKVYKPNGKQVMLNGQRTNNATPRVFGKTRTVTISGTSITTLANTTSQYTINNNATGYVNTENYIFIIRVVGYANTSIPNELEIYDTGWQALTPLVGNWTVLRCRRIGNMVTVEGHISSWSYGGSATNVSTLPEQYRPVGKTEYIYGFAGGRRISRWYITVAGTLGVDWVADISNGALYTGATWNNFTITYMVN